MSDSLAHAVGAGIHIELRGNEYTLSKLNMGCWGELEEYIKSKRLKQFLAVANGLDSAQFTQIVAEIQRTPVPVEELAVEAETMTGLQFVLYLSLRIKHPDITHKQVGELIDLDNFDQLAQHIPVILKGASESPPPAAKEEPSTGDLPSPS